MRLSDIQPQYFPRLHYFARMLSSDRFVLRDDVQFVRNHMYPGGQRGVSYQAHTPIKGPKGPILLAVSVAKGSGLPLRRTSLCYQQKWRTKHINTICQHYRSAPNADRLLPSIRSLLTREYPSVAALNVATICWSLAHLLGREESEASVSQVNQWLSASPDVRLENIELGSSCLEPGADARASGAIVELCKHLGASEYLAGETALKSYLEPELFENSGLELVVQSWQCPSYPQRYKQQSAYVANLSILDLLLNAPPDGPSPVEMLTQSNGA